MSEISTAVTPEHFRYIAERAVVDDDFLLALKDAARSEGIPAIWVSPEQASFMQVLLRLSGAREVVEVGTLAGYSAIRMARALPEGGRVRSIELSARHADFAEEWIRRSDVAGRIEVCRGSGAEWLPRFGSASADAAFVDADKGAYPFYLEECARILRPGGMILVDNAFAYGHLLEQGSVAPDVEAIRSFNDLMASSPQWQGVIVPIGDGCWVGVRQAP